MSQTEKRKRRVCACACVCGNRKWRLYLKLGAEAHSRAKQATSTAAYTSRKKMVTMLAMVLSFPEKRTSWRKTGKVGGLTNASTMGGGEGAVSLFMESMLKVADFSS